MILIKRLNDIEPKTWIRGVDVLYSRNLILDNIFVLRIDSLGRWCKERGFSGHVHAKSLIALDNKEITIQCMQSLTQRLISHMGSTIWMVNILGKLLFLLANIYWHKLICKSTLVYMMLTCMRIWEASLIYNNAASLGSAGPNTTKKKKKEIEISW